MTGKGAWQVVVVVVVQEKQGKPVWAGTGQEWHCPIASMVQSLSVLAGWPAEGLIRSWPQTTDLRWVSKGITAIIPSSSSSWVVAHKVMSARRACFSHTHLRWVVAHTHTCSSNDIPEPNHSLPT